MNSTAEIKTIILLTGNRRIPELEEEIFANDELTTLYLHTLCRDYYWFDTALTSPNSELAYIYVAEVLRTRWPAAEKLIISTPEDACCYAKYVLNVRLPEAEAMIRKSKYWWNSYLRHFENPD